MDALALARTLERDLLPPLSDAELALVLAWLGRSGQSPEVKTLERRLGQAGDKRELTRRILDQLDGLLFADGNLDLETAGLGPDAPVEASRRRFRALLGAFHPDRFPWHAEWLTARFQAVNTAYAEFKARPAADANKLVASGPLKQGESAATKYRGIAPGSPRQDSIFRSLRNDRWLSHKLVGALSLLLVLPLVSWWLDDGWLSRITSGADADGVVQSASDSVASGLIPGPIEAQPLAVAELPDFDRRQSIEDEDLDSRDLTAESDKQGIQVAEATTADRTRPYSCASTEAMQSGLRQLADEFGWEHLPTPALANRGRLGRGPLQQDSIAAVLERYRTSLESGDLDVLLRQLIQAPRANSNQGRSWFHDHYGELFSKSIDRRLSIDVVDEFRQGDVWVVVVDYRLSFSTAGCIERLNFRREVRFHLVQDPLVFRIAAMEY